MAQKLKIKKGDSVAVITGRDAGKKGEILKVFPKELKVLVSGVNIAKRHTKASPAGAAGIHDKEMPLHISNVALLDPKTQKPTRVGYKLLNDGTKVRISKSSGEVLDA